MKKFTSFFVLLTFVISCIVPPQGFAQSLTAMGLMPQPGTMVTTTPVFKPAQLWGMTIHPNDPFKFDFLVRKGDVVLSEEKKREEYTHLIKYFLAALATPETDQWVNLSPYEQDRIIPDNFGMTLMGRDLLAQDYFLKQLTSSLINPDTDLGKKFWDGVYAKAFEKFGTTEVPTDMFNKVWIMPDQATVFEKNNTVYVLESHLKVLTEKDYLAAKNNVSDEATAETDQMADISSQMIKEVIIPAIEEEVNNGKNFAPLRQVYSGMLLATWYKVVLKESILGKLYADKGKVKGIDQDPKANQEIFDQYVAAFQKGVVNMIKEDVDLYSQETIARKYFTGGFVPRVGKDAYKEETNVSNAQRVTTEALKNDDSEVISSQVVPEEEEASALKANMERMVAPGFTGTVGAQRMAKIFNQIDARVIGKAEEYKDRLKRLVSESPSPSDIEALRESFDQEWKGSVSEDDFQFNAIRLGLNNVFQSSKVAAKFPDVVDREFALKQIARLDIDKLKRSPIERFVVSKPREFQLTPEFIEALNKHTFTVETPAQSPVKVVDAGRPMTLKKYWSTFVAWVDRVRGKGRTDASMLIDGIQYPDEIEGSTSNEEDFTLEEGQFWPDVITDKDGYGVGYQKPEAKKSSRESVWPEVQTDKDGDLMMSKAFVENGQTAPCGA